MPQTGLLFKQRTKLNHKKLTWGTRCAENVKRKMDGETQADNGRKEQFHLDLQQPRRTVPSQRMQTHIHTVKVMYSDYWY